MRLAPCRVIAEMFVNTANAWCYRSLSSLPGGLEAQGIEAAI
jgi:hypothetical protein